MLMAKGTAKARRNSNSKNKPNTLGPLYLVRKLSSLSRWQIALLLPVLIFLAWGAYDRVADYFDTQGFMRAREDMDTLASKVEQDLGLNPDQKYLEVGCSRPNLKFREGGLICYYNRILEFSNVTDDTTVLDRVAQIVDSSTEFTNLSGSPDNPHVSENIKSSLFTFKNSKSTQCHVLANYGLSTLTLRMSIGCSANARSEHYPRVD